MEDRQLLLDEPNVARRPLRRPVTTGRDNEVRVRPFDVVNLWCLEKWDPTRGRLVVVYQINDPNERAVAGRIVYAIVGTLSAYEPDHPEFRPRVVHQQTLSTDQIRSGVHALPENQQWDGTITEGPTDLIGQKVTADLAPIRVYVEVSNRPIDRSTPPGERGDRARREFRSHARSDVEIDVITQARWDRTFVIPYDDPEEPQHGFARMRIRVRNVREGTPVRVRVIRIGSPDNRRSGELYARSWNDPANQPGLEDLVVRQGSVRHRNGSLPEVRFNNYDEHWKYPGNNFYCFEVAFGHDGGWLAASERDYVNRERDCLHMRFTVYINAGTTVDKMRLLHNFFRRETRYFRSYLNTSGPATRASWHREWSRRYIVIHKGHGFSECRHEEHPFIPGSERKLGQYHSGFPPDKFICPMEILSGHEQEVEEERQFYLPRYPNSPVGVYGDGCGFRSHVSHWIHLGRWTSENRGRMASFGNPPGESNRRRLATLPGEQDDFDMPAHFPPRFAFIAGGCRTMLTKNLGECFTQNGTRYYHGWVYSVDRDINTWFILRLFAGWIKGTLEDPATDEYDPARFAQTYARESQHPGVAADAPRLMSARGPFPPHFPTVEI